MSVALSSKTELAGFVFFVGVVDCGPTKGNKAL